MGQPLQNKLSPLMDGWIFQYYMKSRTNGNSYFESLESTFELNVK